jgi:hypothetical protein
VLFVARRMGLRNTTTPPVASTHTAPIGG